MNEEISDKEEATLKDIIVMIFVIFFSIIFFLFAEGKFSRDHYTKAFIYIGINIFVGFLLFLILRTKLMQLIFYGLFTSANLAFVIYCTKFSKPIALGSLLLVLGLHFLLTKKRHQRSI